MSDVPSYEQMSDHQRAVRLLTKALDPGLRASRDAEYGRLIARYRSDLQFARLCVEAAAVQELRILGANSSQLMVQPASRASPYAMGLTELRSRLSGDNLNDRALVMLCMAAIIAGMYRHGADIARPSNLDNPPRVTAEDAEELLHELCVALQEKSDATPSRERGQLEGWRQVLLKTRRTDEERRAGMGSRLGIIRLLLTLWKSHHLLVEDDSGEKLGYLPTERFRAQVTELFENETFVALMGAAGIEVDGPAEFPIADVL